MIKIGIVGFGNVAWNVHFPVLLSRDDIKISWICDLNNEKKYIIEKKKIKFFENIDDALSSETVDIILFSTPYGVRSKIFEKIKKKCGGIFFEKPHAKTLEEHKYFQDLFEPYSLTIGYTRRKMGIVDSMKKILEQKIFGDLRTVKMFFGDVHYRFDTFRSNIKKSGGGIFLEAGIHWFDCIFFTTNAKEINNFHSEKKFENNLDIESSGNFEIINKKDDQLTCEFTISTLKNTFNKIEYNFDNCSVDLFLFDNDSNLIVRNKNKKQFIIQDNEYLNFPSNSFDITWHYWNDYLNSFNLKKESNISYNSFYLTTKITDLFYDN